ncbi:MAG TPA: SCO family protein [Bacteroidota bacterium]|nr:SCO family protein [Bacteroidota bacterium]
MPSYLSRVTWIVLSVLAVGIITTRIYLASHEKKSELPIISQVQEFSLTTEDNSIFTHNDLQDKITIADFIFTTCAGPCPLMSERMKQLQQDFANEPSIQFLSFSVDPEYDTPQVLTEYAQRFGAIKTRWTFLTGDKQAMYTLIQKGFHLGVEDDTNAIIHSTKFVLLDGEANIRGYYDSEDEESLISLSQDARSLIRTDND